MGNESLLAVTGPGTTGRGRGPDRHPGAFSQRTHHHRAEKLTNPNPHCAEVEIPGC